MPVVVLNRPKVNRGATLLEGLNNAFQGFQQGRNQATQRQQATNLNNARIDNLEAETTGLNTTNEARGGIAEALQGIQLPSGLGAEQFGTLLNSGGSQGIGDIINTIGQGNARDSAVGAINSGDTGIASQLSSIASGESIPAPFSTNSQGLTTNQFDSSVSSGALTDSIVRSNNAQANERNAGAFENRQAGLLDQEKAKNVQNGVVSPTEALRQKKLQLEVGSLQEENQKADRAKNNAVDSALAKSQNVLNNIESARDLVGGTTTGALGAITRNIPGFDGFDLAQKVDTIRANLGIDELLRVKAAGGTFGALSDTELNVLQNSIANLNQAQSQEEFQTQLTVIEQQYQRTMQTLQQERGGVQAPQEQAPQQTLTARNPQTGEVITSSDGGQTWSQTGGGF